MLLFDLTVIHFVYVASFLLNADPRRSLVSFTSSVWSPAPRFLPNGDSYRSLVPLFLPPSSPLLNSDSHRSVVTLFLLPSPLLNGDRHRSLVPLLSPLSSSPLLNS